MSPPNQRFGGRPKSEAFGSPTSQLDTGHSRNQSFSPSGSLTSIPSHIRGQSAHVRTSSSTTFAPQFIKTEDLRTGPERVNGIEGENDFSGKRYVWLRDTEKAFVKGWIAEDLSDDRILVQCDDGSQREASMDLVDKVNPGKFDKADDMAELTHLNEASVIHNLQIRYQADLIYTYSGLFLVAINPYCPLSIYSNEYVRMYKNQAREDTRPHIFAVSDQAFRRLVEEGENQSILVTGESGAGKTENTKKVIQYLAAVATSETPMTGKSPARHVTNLSQQILRANPILEAFGNAQTVRNHNSSRFGKFIRIQFTRSGQIAGAFIDWYLLEKSRVVKVGSQERNYHVFYQLLSGADQRLKESFLLQGMDIEDFAYTRGGNDSIAGVSDHEEWNSLLEAFHVMNFSDRDQTTILKTIAAVLHLGNVTVVKESSRADQAMLSPEAFDAVERACRLLGVNAESFVKGLLHPKVKAGREWVEKVQTPEQVQLSIDALAKSIYERGFGDLVAKINVQLDRGGLGSDENHFIGVLDIAGFEIFENNSFEQLCINYTNEKLQQFFNHHMFVLEQEEYAREQIEWQFIDFGKDLQPTIDLIELPNPIGIFSCLDEDSVMPKATDKSFTEKLHSLWERKTPKYAPSRLHQGFILTHYAAEVEYCTDDWLEKNKDPLNDNLTRLLSASSDKHMANLFVDCAEEVDDLSSPRSRVKKGLFRTVAQRHKEQLSSLMAQLHSTHPHFVRCIIPNHKKKPKQFHAPLVLDQLRCNGVLEGIRIARTGFPNRLPFAEFRSRYEVLCRNMPKGYLDGQEATNLMLERLSLDPAVYRVGLTKVFFRAGVLAELEEQRDSLIREIMSRFQSLARGFTQRRIANKRLYRTEATRVIQRNLNIYLDLQANPWWRLFVRMRPLLGGTRTAGEVKKRDEKIEQLQAKMEHDLVERQRIEEDRRRADGEIQRIQQTLESERALALDKEEIFKRLQNRENELSDKLAGAIADQETLEDQLDDMIASKKKVEEELTLRCTQLEQAGLIITRLEAEKKDLQQEVDELDDQLDNLEKTRSEKDSHVEGLDEEIRMLTSQLSLRDRKLKELETKLLKTDQDLDVKLASATKELHVSKTQIKDLLDENRSIRKQIADLSSTSTDYEDLVRRKESELAMLRSDLKRHESIKDSFESEKNALANRHDSMQKRLREVQGEMDAIKSQKATLEREAADAKRLLEAKISQDMQSGESRKMLDQQIKDLKAQLFEVQAELGRERQSRDDVQMLGDHQMTEMKDKYNHLNESKITIEKEMYIQQDVLRRATEAKAKAEQRCKDLQADLIDLRERFSGVEAARLEAEATVERNVMKQANERQASLRRELDAKAKALEEAEAERMSLHDEVQRLKKTMMESENFRSRNDQHKERLERELVTVKGRLTASENDNRALLNKIQQKNLDIARSNSRAGDNQKVRMMQLQSEKARLEEENKKLSRQVTDASLSISSLEKQKEKLALSLEDLQHEVAREHKTSRTAEKASSAVNIQLAEANRNLESERQLKTQAQVNTRKLQSTLDQANTEVHECRQQLMLLQKLFSEEAPHVDLEWEASQPHVQKIVDLATIVEALHTDLRTSEEKCARAETQLAEMRQRHADEVSDLDARYTTSKRAILEEIDNNKVSSPNGIRSPTHGIRRTPSNGFNHFPIHTTPSRLQKTRDIAPDSGRSDRTVDTVAFQKNMDYATELEELQNQLQMTQMQNKHLQAQLERTSPVKDSWDDSPSIRRVQKLERENGRLHEKLDDSAKTVSALERSIRNGELSVRDVQTKSHEELFDLIKSQESSRKDLLQVHNSTLAELTEAKAHFDKVKQAKAATEVELRDARSDLRESQLVKEQDAASRQQLLEEFSDLQIRLDTESSKVVDLASSLSLYKTRADEYFNKLEQAEITVLKASRAESFAKSQAKEAEDTCAAIMAERKQMDNMVEDLQRQVQSYEEKIEDMASDLDNATQAKKRLQHELEDYRSQRAMDIEDKETSIEQARKKYQMEFATLHSDLEIERENVIHERQENTRIREELEELRSKWDDEVLNSSTWAKEKSRMEIILKDLRESRDEASNAHNEAQSKIVSLLSQVRNLRTSVDDTAAERDNLLKEKRTLEARLAEASERLEGLASGDSTSIRNAASLDKNILDLKSKLAQQEDVASAAVGKMRRSESLATEMQKDVIAERENNVQLFKEKSALEQKLKEVQMRCVDLETKGAVEAVGGKDVRFLTGRITEVSQAVRDNRLSLLTHCAARTTTRIRDLPTQQRSPHDPQR
jgi:myosin heavy chain 9/10/11/14